MRPPKLPLLLLALVSVPCALHAQQRPVSIGAGLGITQSDALAGRAAHLRLSAPLMPVGDRLSIHAELVAQQGTITGNPSDCTLVQETVCTGRSDLNRLVGAGTFLRLDVGSRTGRVRAYLTPVGVGLYHRRTRSEEFQAPIRSCITEGQLGPCGEAAPLDRITSSVDRTSLGLSLGGGVEIHTAGVRLFADARVHRLVEGRDSRAGAAPVTVGVAF